MIKAKILFLDIEATNLKANVGYVLSIGYKWSYEKKSHVLRIDDTKQWQKDRTDDSGLLKLFEPVFEEADIVVHHFGDHYDIPFLQTRRLIHGMLRMPDARTVDTWKICKYHLCLTRNSLDTILNTLECPFKKTHFNYKQWMKASAGMKSGIDYVVLHNKMDVLVQEWVYNRIAPLLPSHPTVTPDRFACKTCSSRRLKGHGWIVCQKYWYQRLLCQKCGHTMKGSIRAKEGK